MALYSQLVPWLRYIVPACASLLLLGAWWSHRVSGPRRQGLFTVAFAMIAVLAMMDYTAWHVRERNYENPYEMFHYYLPSRYADELGYMGLYEATVAASEELGIRPVKSIRDLRSGKHIPHAQALEKAGKVRARFSPERWSDWKRDVSMLRGMVPEVIWRQMLRDRGYNATPVWTMVGGALASHVRPGEVADLVSLALVDVVFWAAALLAIGLAFGPRPALLMLIVLGSNYVTSFYTLKAAFIRVDWICCLLGAMAATKRGWPMLAGALVGYAGLSRVFPFVFAFGPLVPLLSTAWRERRVDRDAARFLLGLVGVCAVLLPASVIATSPEYWREFLHKIGGLTAATASWRIGFAYLLAGAWDGYAWGGGSISSFFKNFWWLDLAFKGGALVAAGWLSLRVREPWERLVIGFFLMFFLVNASYYYYVVLLVPTVWLANQPGRLGAVLLLVWMFACSIGAHRAMGVWDRSFPLFVSFSVGVLGLVLGMGWLMSREGARQQHA